ncbi:hypothetical protein PYW07_003982 [Mythimna separata]|uniref:Uncharacterized protein n=1 Tax=Mythimna separata TaxID=271217 RepID=A0AAD8DTL0_MYTSE|nr:hypothetical protein PYW07_003982 [Mythimna separata]
MLKLRKLHLNSSSLLCDCNLLWIVKWIKEKAEQKYVTANCAYPSEVRGVSVTKLKEDNCGDSPKPKVVEHPKTHLAIKGRSANLVCSATSIPFNNMTFLWRKNNGNVSNPVVYENITIGPNGQPRATSVLVIPNVTHADSGKYQCVVGNNFGTTYSTKAKVNIVTFPRFTKTPTNVTVKTGDTVTLNCAATGDPPPEISWKKDGGNDFPAARERRMNVMPTDHLFFIVNAKTTDMGIYSCAAKNPAGTIIANATLTVLQEPSFVRVMENKEVTSGDSVVLQCMISGSPKPVIKWLKDGTPITATERHFLTADDQLLIIIGSESSDAGRYECEITNELGTKKDMTELRVLPPVAIMPGYGGDGAPQQGYPGAPPQGYPGAPQGYGQPAGYGAGGPPPGQLEIGHGPYPSIGPGGGVNPQVQNWFQAVDKDRSGFITAIELKAALVNAQGQTFSETACNLMIGMFDKDRSGHINVEEFEKLYTYINQWLAVFKTYDTDQSGSIEEKELSDALTKMGFRFTPEFVSFLVKRCDSKEGKVSVDNFIVLCVQIQRFTEAFRARDTQQNGTVTIGFEDFLNVALSCSI